MKLQEWAKSKDIFIRYIQCNLLTEPESKVKEVRSLLQLEESDGNLSYAILDNTGYPIPFTKHTENLLVARKCLSGIPSFNNQITLKNHLLTISDESLHIITQSRNKGKNQSETSNAIRKYFFENSHYFSEHSFNFFQLSGLLEKILFKNRDRNDVLLAHNLNYISSAQLESIKANADVNNLYLLDVYSATITPINESIIESILSKRKEGQVILSSDTSKTNLICSFLKLEDYFPPKTDKTESASTSLYFNTFLDVIKMKVDPLDLKTSNPESFKRLMKNELLKIDFSRIYSTYNIDKALYYKTSFYNEKNKVILVYYEEPNHENNIKLQLQEILQKSLQSNTNEDIRVLLTKNSHIARIFNIIPQSKEQVVIRYIDYSNLVNFDGENYNLIERDNILGRTSPAIDPNSLFVLKYKFNAENVNETTMRDFIESCLSKQKLKPYLESYETSIAKVTRDEDDIVFEDIIQSLEGVSFKQKILEIGKGSNDVKIVLGVSDNCVGCVKVKTLLRNLFYENPNSNGVEIFEYNRNNESQYAKKFKKAPVIFVYKGGKLLTEIDVANMFETNKDYNEEIKTEINKYI